MASEAGGYGVYGGTTASTGAGVAGYFASDSSSGTGVYATSRLGVHGVGTQWGVAGESASNGTGVQGQAPGVFGIGVYGIATANGRGVYGTSAGGNPAIEGWASSTSGLTYAVFGNVSSPNGTAVFGGLPVGIPGSGAAIRGLALSGGTYAVYGEGNAHFTGVLSKGGGAFKIDHPLDPENYYLQHSFVESPDMKNVYDGVATCGDDGRATVDLPEYFELLNRDFRYQLTCIGGYAPVYVDAEVESGRFAIAGGTPGLRVSWQVTGIRKDPWAERNRIEPVLRKKEHEVGTYLNPELYDMPRERALFPPPNVSEIRPSGVPPQRANMKRPR